MRTVRYGGGISEDTDRGRSPYLWSYAGGSHFEEGLLGSNTAYRAYFDDFIKVPISGGEYILTESDDNAAWAGPLDTDTGEFVLTLSTDDNEEGNIMWGGVAEATIGNITEDSGIKTYFEARFKVSSVSDDDIAVYVGLAEEGMTGANMQTDNTGVLSAKDYIMFRTVHVNGGTTGTNAVLGAAYNTNAGTEVSAITTADTLVADTFVKVGFVHDGRSTVTYFVNGVPNATTSDPSDTTFPDGEELTFAAGAKLGDTAGGTLTLDWWGYARVDMWANS